MQNMITPRPSPLANEGASEVKQTLKGLKCPESYMVEAMGVSGHEKAIVCAIASDAKEPTGHRLSLLREQ